MAMSEKPRLVWLNTVDIKIPEIRITSVWNPEDYEMFQASIKAMGIVDKPVVVLADRDFQACPVVNSSGSGSIGQAAIVAAPVGI